MDDEIIFESSLATLWYHSKSQTIHHQFHEPIQGEAFRNIMMLGTHTKVEKGAHKWLSDDRAVLAVIMKVSDWTKICWFPETLKARWNHWAIVQPKHIISHLNLEKVAERYSALRICPPCQMKPCKKFARSTITTSVKAFISFGNHVNPTLLNDCSGEFLLRHPIM